MGDPFRFQVLPRTSEWNPTHISSDSHVPQRMQASQIKQAIVSSSNTYAIPACTTLTRVAHRNPIFPTFTNQHGVFLNGVSLLGPTRTLICDVDLSVDAVFVHRYGVVEVVL